MPMLTRLKLLARFANRSAVILCFSLLAFLAVARPASIAGGISALLLVAAAGCIVALYWSRAPRIRLTRFVRDALPFVPLIGAGLWLYLQPLCAAPRWRNWDWGTHHALTRILSGAITKHGGVPRWVMSVSTGDSPYELYPCLPTLLVALPVALFKVERRVPFILLAVAIALHIVRAIQIQRLAGRLASRPVAMAAGLLALYDAGSFETGAARSIIEVGLWHAAVAQCLTLIALVAAVDFLRRPSWRARVAIWSGMGVACVAHPLSLLFIAACAPAVLLTILTAADVRARRVLGAAFHLGLGTALTAAWWLPFVKRSLAYGLPFGYPAWRLTDTVAHYLSGQWPPTSYPIIIVLGCLGIVAGVVSRRTIPTLMASLSLFLLLGVADSPHLLAQTVSHPAFALLQPWRLLAIAHPLLYACAAWIVELLISALRRRSPQPARFGTAALGGVAALLVLVGLRAALPFLDQQSKRLREQAVATVPDPDGFAEIVDWAREQASRTDPTRFERLLFVDGEHYIYHLTAETGLPTATIGEGCCGLMMRERMEDLAPDSLRRFNVRWLLGRARRLDVGDPATQRCFGSYCLREVADWDGRFARVEKGRGRLTVTRIEDERVELELGGTNAPALVVFGMSAYPRWRARDEDGRKLDVFPYPATARGQSRVSALWLPPGRAILTADGPLPSDGSGLGFSMLAALVLIAQIACACAARIRWRALRLIATVFRRLWIDRRILSAVTVLLGATSFAAWAWRESSHPEPALSIGHSLFSDAAVDARTAAGEWIHCRYAPLEGQFRCGNLGALRQGVARSVLGQKSGGAYLATSIVAEPAKEKIEFRVTVRRRLGGVYYAQKKGAGRVTLEANGVAPILFEKAVRRVDVGVEQIPREWRLTLFTRTAAPVSAIFVGEWLLRAIRSQEDESSDEWDRSSVTTEI